MDYEYALRISHVDTDEARDALYQWIRERGECCGAIGVDEHGDATHRVHFHAVIRTRIAKNKKDENVFQRKGRLAKYLQERVPGFNPVSFVLVRHGWHAAVSYAVKQGVATTWGFEFVPEDYVYVQPDDRVRSSGSPSKKSKKDLSAILLRIWEDNGKPTEIFAIYSMLWKSPDTSPGSFDSTLIMRKAMWLYQRANPECSDALARTSFAHTFERMTGTVYDFTAADTSDLAPIFRK